MPQNRCDGDQRELRLLVRGLARGHALQRKARKEKDLREAGSARSGRAARAPSSAPARAARRRRACRAQVRPARSGRTRARPAPPARRSSSRSEARSARASPRRSRSRRGAAPPRPRSRGARRRAGRACGRAASRRAGRPPSRSRAAARPTAAGRSARAARAGRPTSSSRSPRPGDSGAAEERCQRREEPDQPAHERDAPQRLGRLGHRALAHAAVAAGECPVVARSRSRRRRRGPCRPCGAARPSRRPGRVPRERARDPPHQDRVREAARQVPGGLIVRQLSPTSGRARRTRAAERTSTMIRMIQRIDTEEPPSSVVA